MTFSELGFLVAVTRFRYRVLVESFRPSYIHYEDYVKKILEKFVRVVSEIYKKALKSKL